MRIRRAILSQPGYFTLAVGIIALSVGANLVVFTIVNALWLRARPFPDADRVVIILGDTSNSGSTDPAAYGGVDQLRIPLAFDSVAGQAVTSGPRADQFVPHVQFSEVGYEVETLGVTADYFSMLGLTTRGRDFKSDDDQVGAEPVAIISDRLWKKQFDTRAEVIGAVAAAHPFGLRIVGVAPPGFHGARLGERADVWIPRSLVPRVSSAGDMLPPLMVLARLRNGVTPEQAERLVMEATDERVLRTGGSRHVVPIAKVFGTPNSRSVIVREHDAAKLTGALAGLVLLAGCATLMALVLIHYERRRQELSVRLALGATRARLAGQLAVELAWLVASGTAGAVFIAFLGLRGLPALSLPGGVDVTRLDLSIDWHVLVAGITLSVFTLTLAGLLPVVRFTAVDVARNLVTARGTSTSSSQRIRQALLGLHVTATVIVLVSAALFLRAIAHGFTAAPGFDVGHSVFVSVQVVSPFVRPGEDNNARKMTMATRTRRLAEGLASLPGVDAISMGRAPIGPDRLPQVMAPRAVITDGRQLEVRVATIQGSPGYLETLGVPILIGRALEAADVFPSPTPAVLTASLAETLWPAETPLGRTLSIPPRGHYTIVGVVADFRVGSLTTEPAGVVVSATDTSGLEAAFTLRTSQPAALGSPLEQLVRSIVPEASRLEISTGPEVIARDLGRQQLGAWFFSGFGFVALALAVVGVFGLVAYLAEARRREFGVRLALGATRRDLVRHAMSAGLGPVVAGTALGLIAAGLIARFMAALLVGVSPLDPLSYVVVGMLIITSAALAGLAASWRLRHISPSAAVRSE